MPVWSRGLRRHADGDAHHPADGHAQGDGRRGDAPHGSWSANLRTLKHITTVPFLGATTAETDIDLVPSLVAGPPDGWCAGAKWTVNPSTQTVIVRSIAGTQQIVNQVVGSEGEVLAVDGTITVAGRTTR